MHPSCLFIFQQFALYLNKVSCPEWTFNFAQRFLPTGRSCCALNSCDYPYRFRVVKKLLATEICVALTFVWFVLLFFPATVIVNGWFRPAGYYSSRLIWRKLSTVILLKVFLVGMSDIQTDGFVSFLNFFRWLYSMWNQAALFPAKYFIVFLMDTYTRVGVLILATSR